MAFKITKYHKVSIIFGKVNRNFRIKEMTCWQLWGVLGQCYLSSPDIWNCLDYVFINPNSDDEFGSLVPPHPKS